MTASHQQGRPAVLVVGGWSPGPLLYLSSTLHQSHVVIQPRRLPMPPFPGEWCCHPSVVLLTILLGVFVWLSCRSDMPTVWRIAAAIVALGTIRILVAVVLRSSISITANSCLEAIRPYDGNVVLIGFSWGGAVLAKMIADRKLQPEPRGILLIAPTTSIVSKLAFQTDPASSISSMESLNVVHGIYDTAFCPHQTRWADENLYRLQDDHVFFSPSSQHFLKNLVTSILNE